MRHSAHIDAESFFQVVISQVFLQPRWCFFKIESFQQIREITGGPKLKHATLGKIFALM